MIRHPKTNRKIDGVIASGLNETVFECMVYNEHCPTKFTTGCKPETQTCKPISPVSDLRPACIIVWSNDTTNGVKVNMQGCISVQDIPPMMPTQCGETECVATKPTITDGGRHVSYSCCCHKSNCNSEFRLELAPETPRFNNSTARTMIQPSAGNELANSLIYALLPICLIALLVAFTYWVYRRFRLRRLLQMEAESGVKGRLPRCSLPLKPIDLMEIVSKGRYGCIWKAQLYDKQIVAVKVFPATDAESWIQEQDIYATPRMREHPNILTFFGAEARGAGVDGEFWLITAYQEHGSMYDFLKRNTLKVPEALRLATSMLRGLAFLHEEYLGDEQTYKPTIVHRDFKSKNVLIKSDMTACIADFGLAVKCDYGRPPAEVHAQVGTRRYMAPEVLEGATEFSAFAFRQIDVYACALVLWELFSRSSLTGEPVGDYRLPFEDVVGQKPSLTALQFFVVKQKARPKFKSQWRQNPHGILICTTVEEMWDMEAEARISAGCGLERLLAVASMFNSSSCSASDSGVSSTASTDTMPLISDYSLNMAQGDSGLGPMEEESVEIV